MRAFFSRRLRMWLLLTIALPLTQAVVHRLALVPSAVIRPPEQRRRSAKPKLMIGKIHRLRMGKGQGNAL